MKPRRLTIIALSRDLSYQKVKTRLLTHVPIDAARPCLNKLKYIPSLANSICQDMMPAVVRLGVGTFQVTLRGFAAGQKRFLIEVSLFQGVSPQ